MRLIEETSSAMGLLPHHLYPHASPAIERENARTKGKRL
jgi:hypothetical protein